MKETQDFLPTPSHTQRHLSHGQPPQQSTSQYRERPGPNQLVQHAGHRLRGSSPVPDQHQTRGQGGHQSGTSHREQRTIEKKWTHVAKIYGMLYSPWVPESALDQALCHEAGQELSEDDPDQELVQFLDDFDVSNCERKDPQFQTNVSLIPPKYLF